MSSDTAGSPAPRRRGADSGALEGAPKRSHRDPIIAIHRGRGDGSIIEFRSVVDRSPERHGRAQRLDEARRELKSDLAVNPK